MKTQTNEPTSSELSPLQQSLKDYVHEQYGDAKPQENYILLHPEAAKELKELGII